MTMIEQLPVIDRLSPLRRFAGERLTTGLSDQQIETFASRDPKLLQAIDAAVTYANTIAGQYPQLVDLDEQQQIEQIQQGYLNFYNSDAINPYVAAAAAGPWIVTLKGAVLYDTGGYGMLGLGHAPEVILDAMNQPHVMANIMTPNISQMALMAALRREVGHNRSQGCPYRSFLCINSGSESVSVAARISDINAKLMTEAGGKHEGKRIVRLALKGAFHGRTDRPAQYSDSSMSTYKKYLASFQQGDNLLTVAANDCEGLQAAFEYADKEQLFIESMFFEPVMGEGNPGLATTPEFYALARRLTEEHGALLLADSIQAGLRTTGNLSITDYPGFENLSAPDMETYSKAINGGQYPLSVLALNEKADHLYQKGLYGNTMTTNPRAMDVAVAVLNNMSDDLRTNIVSAGEQLVAKFTALQAEMNGAITAVQGTGLLMSVELSDTYKCYGADSTEEYMRTRGVNVIHGGTNSLRFTPWFGISDEEIDLLVDVTRDALLNGPRKG
ncbi:aminotransferase class III-fold pyridoxal phosphate-dependent enzyme [Porticoccus sp. W117]|uniref:aminotransferase class III-fold pyridoxal phosphate-dependent enzyme n=1 Tax=Porticoccus sp. W117 TaxID=3054777 RepID=UPI00259672EF|nr:aminotransferase class III-fold pyridoxal phosphate-dependent enzyme [Porticoccus sp. W117]MDM3871999.1 aminotransferase class III-fold pyridoxal phosphate-dependent enzyme [Porticoccus sp. W117]